MLAMLLLAATPARADDETVNGFVAYGAGELTGHVTNDDGKPMRAIEVHVVSKTGGEQIVKTGADGAFRVQLKGTPGETSMIFVRGHTEAHVGGQTAVQTAIEGGEAVEIHETLPPAVVAKAISNPLMIPEYSDVAMDRDVWTRAWLLLDVSETGAVRHLKLLKRAGFELDPIAVREGFKLKFEWPTYSWLIDHHEGTYRMPPDVVAVRCQKPGESRPHFRDCSQPDLQRGLSESWIAPRKPKR
jgi:hypothetical protein